MLTGSLVALFIVMIVFWGRSGNAGASLATASVSNVRSDLADAGCIFTADVRLESPWQQWAFARVKTEARKEFVAIMRSKRRYMVENPVERQALGAEMAVAINHLARCEIAERVEFSRFELF